MAYSAPTTRATGFFVTAPVWNQDVVNNVAFLANPPACRVYHSANQSVPNGGNITVAFNSERYDTDTMHDTVTLNSRITFKTAGLFVLTYNQHLTAANDYTYIFTGIRLNGATYIAADSRQNNAAATSPDIAVVTTYKFAVNDYVEVVVQQNSTAARNIETNTNYSPEFAATWVGLG